MFSWLIEDRSIIVSFFQTFKRQFLFRHCTIKRLNAQVPKKKLDMIHQLKV